MAIQQNEPQRIPRHYIHQGDELPELFLSVYNESDGELKNLAGLTNLKFSMTRRGAMTPTIDNVDATLASTSSAPQLKYAWSGSDTAVAGIYEGLFTGELDGKQLSFPNDAFIEIYVLKKLKST